MNRIKEISNAVEQMDKHLRNELFVKDGILSEKQLWENTFINKQIIKRKDGGQFKIQDHIRAMVYSMLSSGASWRRVLDYTDVSTGKIIVVDEIFEQYEPGKLLGADIEKIKNDLGSKHLRSQFTNNQMKVLKDNIKTFQKMQEEHGTIDNYYSQLIEEDSTKIKLISELATPRKRYKLKQLGFALTCEYLRNVGYDMPKPDRHICRILGKDYLNLSENQPVKRKEAFQIVSELAGEFTKPIAEVDYILWSYCANGYGEICLKDINKAKCGKCVVEKCYANKENNKEY